MSLNELLEPAAGDIIDLLASGKIRRSSVERLASAAVISQAISAKRMAAALERIADALGGEDSYALSNMMENAGQAFGLGMRGR